MRRALRCIRPRDGSGQEEMGGSGLPYLSRRLTTRAIARVRRDGIRDARLAAAMSWSRQTAKSIDPALLGHRYLAL